MEQWPNTPEQQWGTPQGHRWDPGDRGGPGLGRHQMKFQLLIPPARSAGTAGRTVLWSLEPGAWDGETPPLGPLPLSADHPWAWTPPSAGLAPSFPQAQQRSGWHGDHACPDHHPSINNAAGEVRPHCSPHPSPTCLLISITVAVACQGRLRLRGTIVGEALLLEGAGVRC